MDIVLIAGMWLDGDGLERRRSGARGDSATDPSP